MKFRVQKNVVLIFLVLLITVCSGYILVKFGSGQALVGIRNGLISKVGDDQDFYWTPQNRPAEFKQETALAPESMRESVAEALGDLNTNERFEVALALSRHLSDGGKRKKGGIRTNTVDAYEIIRNETRGYCSDYSQVMNGLAHIADIPVREWGMSFDAFSGDGHAFNEIFSDVYGKWIFIDSFYSFYVVDRVTGIPLSALEFQQHLRVAESDETIRVVPILEERFKFRTAERALSYYRKGADQLYLYMGNNVFSSDNDSVLQVAGSVSSYLSQSLAIFNDIQPEIRIVPTDTNRQEIDKLYANRNEFFALLLLDFAAAFILIVLFYWNRYARD